VSEGMAEDMRVEAAVETGLGAASEDDLTDAGVAEFAFESQPQPRLGGFAVTATGSLVAVEGFGGPVAERDGAKPVAFAAHHSHAEVQVDVEGVEAGHLT